MITQQIEELAFHLNTEQFGKAKENIDKIKANLGTQNLASCPFHSKEDCFMKLVYFNSRRKNGEDVESLMLTTLYNLLFFIGGEKIV